MEINRREFITGAAIALYAAPESAGGNWPFYAGDAGASRFSPLDRIKASNVARLKTAWVHKTEDASQRPATTIECTPIAVDGVLYLTTARLQVRALNAATGEPIWNFDPNAGRRSSRAPGVNRGVTWFADGKDKRIFAALNDRLFCLNPASGELLRSFGDNGIVDLKSQFDRDMSSLDFKSTSPPVVFEDTLIVGGGGGEGPHPAGPGHVRGYDIYTGKRKWQHEGVSRQEAPRLYSMLQFLTSRVINGCCVLLGQLIKINSFLKGGDFSTSCICVFLRGEGLITVKMSFNSR